MYNSCSESQFLNSSVTGVFPCIKKKFDIAHYITQHYTKFASRALLLQNKPTSTNRGRGLIEMRTLTVYVEVYIVWKFGNLANLET